jgi:hypothetical protein
VAIFKKYFTSAVDVSSYHQARHLSFKSLGILCLRLCDCHLSLYGNNEPSHFILVLRDKQNRTKQTRRKKYFVIIRFQDISQKDGGLREVPRQLFRQLNLYGMFYGLIDGIYFVHHRAVEF